MQRSATEVLTMHKYLPNLHVALVVVLGTICKVSPQTVQHNDPNKKMPVDTFKVG